MRAGLVGCGIVAGYGHIPALAGPGTPGIELVALCDSDPTRLAVAGERWGVSRAYADYHDLVSQPDIDIVAICTHVDTHGPITLAAAEYGKHVLCEKPLADSEEMALRMCEAMDKAELILGTGFILRFARPVTLMKQALSEGRIGGLRVFRSVTNWWGGGHRGAHPGRHERFMAEGGPMFGEAVHHLDLLRFFSGQEIVDVQAAGARVDPFDWPDHSIAHCRLGDGGLGIIENGWAYGHKSNDPVMSREMELIGERGVIRYRRGDREGVEVYGWDETTVLDAPEEKEFPAMYNALIASIEAGTVQAPLASGWDGLRAQQAVTRALESIREWLVPPPQTEFGVSAS